MTVYFIYKNDKINAPFLYAITDNKKLKNSFMKERKKSLFVVKEKEMEKEEFKEILKFHDKYLLGRHGFETKHVSSNKFEKSTNVFLTTTRYEEMDVFTKSDKVILEIGRLTHEYAKCFNTKMLKALDTLHYFEIYKFKNDVFEDYDYFVDGVEPFSINNNRIDSLGVFLYLYGNTLSKK